MEIVLSDDEMSDKIKGSDIFFASLSQEETIYVGLQQYNSDYVCVDRILYFLYGTSEVTGPFQGNLCLPALS